MTEHELSVVIPVYQGEKTLLRLIEEVRLLTEVTLSPDGNPFRVGEVLLVFDNGPDGSAAVIRALTSEHSFVKSVWLSKNFGQHAATLAGMASSGGDWIVTLDEDGQHDPADIGGLLDAALRDQATVVYARPTNPAPHGAFRNAASKVAKRILTQILGSSNASDYQSYRLVLGTIGRSVAAYSGSGVYLDVALGWVASRIATSPVQLRREGDRPSGYSAHRLVSHFLRMMVSAGTRGLRLVSFLGVVLALLGVVFAIVILVQRLSGEIPIQGWASLSVIVLLSSGAILFALGVIAEYIGVNVNMAMGKPPYLITSDPSVGPLGKRNERQS